jgi:DNA/RNA-binding domain of Phe-tRNA-synthetase-like protein
MHGLDKFEVIELDFNHIEFVGQGFVDEVFRVWQNQYPKVQIKYEHAIPEVEFMIKRVLNEKKR